jgi:hypothetical protein
VPVTPFHFGPAALAKASIPKYFSFVAFGLTQVVIDIEPIFFIYQGMWPIHRFFHTYLGATAVALVVALFGKPICESVLKLWNRRLSESQKRWLGVNPRITIVAAVIGALFGGFSHVLLDSIMHSDIQPFAPFSQRNDLLYVISIDRLHEVCVFTGILGAIVLSVLLIRRKALAVRG